MNAWTDNPTQLVHQYGAMTSKPTLPPQADRHEVGLRMKATRLALGLKPRDIYEEIGISRTQWSNYEKGVSRPNIEDAIRFSVRFNISLQWIYLADLSSLPLDVSKDVQRHMKEP